MSTSLKVILIGDTSVGKTTLLTKWNDGQFDPNSLPTINAGVCNIPITIDDKDYNLQVWDTAGQEAYRSIVTTFFRDSRAAMIVFDVTRKDSFNNIPNWINLFQEHRSQTPFLIVGNKSDLLGNYNNDIGFVKFDELQQMGEEFNCPYYFTSALNGSNVNEAFQSLVNLLLEESEPIPYPHQKPVQVTNTGTDSGTKSNCC